MHRTRLSLIAGLAALLLAGCGKDAAPGTTSVAGEDGLPKPDAVSGSVTGMPSPGRSTPNPGQPVELPPEDDLETPADIVPIDGEMPLDGDGMPQTAIPEPPEPETMPMPPTESAVPASGSENPDAGPQ
jgi:hypothetical protein